MPKILGRIKKAEPNRAGAKNYFLPSSIGTTFSGET